MDKQNVPTATVLGEGVPKEEKVKKKGGWPKGKAKSKPKAKAQAENGAVEGKQKKQRVKAIPEQPFDDVSNVVPMVLPNPVAGPALPPDWVMPDQEAEGGNGAADEVTVYGWFRCYFTKNGCSTCKRPGYKPRGRGAGGQAGGRGAGKAGGRGQGAGGGGGRGQGAGGRGKLPGRGRARGVVKGAGAKMKR